MNGTIRTVVITLGIAAAVGVLAGVAYIYSGIYNVAATEPHTALGRWILRTTLVNSVKAHAGRVRVPSVSAEQRRQGAKNFDDMCIVCHGAPGVERGEYGKGLTPTPPNLSKAARHWREEELFWIVKHGIKMAGMPAFGPTHSDDELWGIVSFVKTLPETSAAQYAAIRNERGDSAKTHGDTHREGSGGHSESGENGAGARQ